MRNSQTRIVPKCVLSRRSGFPELESPRLGHQRSSHNYHDQTVENDVFLAARNADLCNANSYPSSKSSLMFIDEDGVGGDVPDNAADTTEQQMLEYLETNKFTTFQLIFVVISLFFYIADVVSDAYLVYMYHSEGNYFWSYLTLTFMLLPAVIMTLFSVSWYFLDVRSNLEPERSKGAWFVRIVLHIFQFAPIVRTTDTMIYGIKSRSPHLTTQERYSLVRLMMYEDADSAMLRSVEAFMEAAPQLLLQLYIQFTQPLQDDTRKRIAQLLSIMVSWISLSWCLTAYQGAMRSSRIDKINLTKSGSFCYFLWKVGVLGSRILAMALFVSAYRGLIFALCMLGHWLISVAFLMGLGTTFCSADSNSWPELFFDLVMAVIYSFDVFNVREGHSRLWFLVCYGIIGIENGLFALFWYFRSSFGAILTFSDLFILVDEEAAALEPGLLNYVPREVFVILVFFLFVFGIGMMIVYYKFEHPTGKIQTCIPLSILLGKRSRDLVSGPNYPVIIPVGPLGENPL